MNKFILALASILLSSSIHACTSMSSDRKSISMEEEVSAWNTVKFPSADELAITADIYTIDEARPYILLCHQAGYSRGEYREIAVKLNDLGFNCMAIDQRSGSACGGVVNETAKGAARVNMSQTYADAEQDINAAIDYLHAIAKSPIIIWGSSYSAALVLKIGNKNEKVSAILAFSPGEYIKGMNITEAATGIAKPLFVTSSKSEGEKVTELLTGITGDNKVQFIPEGNGKHGSKALWTSSEGNQEYWEAVRVFLNGMNPE